MSRRKRRRGPGTPNDQSSAPGASAAGAGAGRRLAWTVAAAASVAALATAGWLATRRSAAIADAAPVELPPPIDTTSPHAPAASEFVGAERCAPCHAAQYTAWRGSTHGTAGGPPSTVTPIAPFDATPIRFRDAEVIPTGRRGYAFTVRQDGRPDRTFNVDAVVGGGHMVGGGTQTFISRFPDGTWRMLPFDWSRQTKTWFCNTESRLNKGWIPITRDLALADCGDWPPRRILGDEPRFSNCQGCHGSQIDIAFDTSAKRWSTSIASLAINCESCHGPARRHVDLMTGASGRSGATRLDVTDSTADAIGLRSLATLDKDQSLGICFQCHALKSQVAMHYRPGAALDSYYALRLTQLGDAPLLPDGRTRTFAYQEDHLSSACYLRGGMTCTSCHDPHSQGYRDAFGTPLTGRFDDRQCTSCHASKAENPARHTKHSAASAGSRCTGCHMPYRQEVGIGTAIQYARADHTISVPRPAFDSTQALTSACRSCHADRSEASLDAQLRTWYGTTAPLDSAVSGAAHARDATGRTDAARQLLVTSSRHPAAVFAGLAKFVEQWLAPDMPELEPDVEGRLRTLARHADGDVRATALAGLHYARGQNAETRRFLAAALAALGAADDARVRGRWSLVLGFLADSLASHGDPAGAVSTYGKALEVTPRSPRLSLSYGLAKAQTGDLSGAMASYRRSLTVEPRQPLVLVNLGIALQASGDPSAAEQAYRRAIALDPNESLAHFNLGNIHLKRGDLTAAIAEYERATSLDPSLAPGYLYLADAYARIGAVRRALDAVRRAMEFDPGNANARLAETKLLQALGDGGRTTP